MTNIGRGSWTLFFDVLSINRKFNQCVLYNLCHFRGSTVAGDTVLNSKITRLLIYTDIQCIIKRGFFLIKARSHLLKKKLLCTQYVD